MANLAIERTMADYMIFQLKLRQAHMQAIDDAYDDPIRQDKLAQGHAAFAKAFTDLMVYLDTALNTDCSKIRFRCSYLFDWAPEEGGEPRPTEYVYLPFLDLATRYNDQPNTDLLWRSALNGWLDECFENVPEGCYCIELQLANRRADYLRDDMKLELRELSPTGGGWLPIGEHSAVNKVEVISRWLA